jgi:ATP-binding cassette subfamily B protein
MSVSSVVRGVARVLTMRSLVSYGPFAALGSFYRASKFLTLGSLVLATCSGLLVPGFFVASGGLIQALQEGRDPHPALLILAAIFGVQRVLDPIREQFGQALWPRVDESLNDRIMAAVSAPFGLREIEDPKTIDLIAQARGAFWGFTPGQAAQQFAAVWTIRVQAVASLLIVANWTWWAGLALFTVYVGSYTFSRRQYVQLSVVVWNQTDRFRRAYYLRSLGLSSEVAKETRIFDLGRWLVQQYRSSSLGVLHDVWQTRREGWLAAFGVVVALLVAEACILGLILRDALIGSLSLGATVIVVQAVVAAGLLSRFEEADFGMTQAGASVRSIESLERLTTTADSAGSGTRDAEGMPRHVIRFENVTFGYPNQPRSVLQSFNLDIEAGRSLAIVGENGAGKTTLIKLLARLYDPTAGRVTVDGVDLREIAPRAWHRRISALFQDFAHFETRAYDNVMFGALHARDDRAAVNHAAAEAGVLDLIERLPNGWETTLGRSFTAGADLSGGEWQRLALARALFGVAGGAGVLILDEPTAALDVRAEAEIYQHFLDLTRGLTTIVISHRFSTVRRADRIVVVEHGQVIENGTHDELVAMAGGRYAEMYTLQANRFQTAEPADA